MGEARENPSNAGAARHNKTAILVIHGMGQQQPFQALDSFVRGLRDALMRAGKAAKSTHHLHGREEVFDHCIRLEVETQGESADASFGGFGEGFKKAQRWDTEVKARFWGVSLPTTQSTGCG